MWPIPHCNRLACSAGEHVPSFDQAGRGTLDGGWAAWKGERKKGLAKGRGKGELIKEIIIMSRVLLACVLPYRPAWGQKHLAHKVVRAK